MTKDEEKFYKGLFIFFCILLSTPCTLWFGYNTVSFIDSELCILRYEQVMGMEIGSGDNVFSAVNDYVSANVHTGMSREEVDETMMVLQDVDLVMSSYITETATIKICRFPGNWITYALYYDNSENYDDNGVLDSITLVGSD
jgi:hypothetical protein